MRKNILFLALVSLMITQQSCLTILNPGWNQKVSINTMEGASININGEHVGTGNIRKGLRKKKNHDINISKDGYLDNNFTINSTRDDVLLGLSFYSWYFTLGAMYILDIPGSRYHLSLKNIEADLLKKPSSQNSLNSITVNSVDIQIDPGKKIGAHYEFSKSKNGKNKFEFTHSWGEDTQIEANTLTELSNDDLKVNNYTIVENNTATLSNTRRADINVSAIIHDMTFDSFERRGNSIVEVSFKIDWKVENKYGKKLLSISTNEKTSRVNDQDLDVFYTAYRKNFYKLLTNNELIELLNKHNDIKDIETHPEDLIIITNDNINSTNNLENLIERATQSTLTIITENGHGSGVIIDSRGYILTCKHVIDESNSIKVLFNNGVELEAKVDRISKVSDLALLKVDSGNLKSLPLGTDISLNLGKEVYAIGTPRDIELGQSVSKGIISGNRKLEETIYIQTDVSVNSGNSGGCLINNEGKVIGIINAKLVGPGIEGIGFAIPVKTILKDLNIKIAKDQL
ncbi:S1C family serine protease [Aureibacter tunicatorum]|uniref:S1-C subfamily serine protease n=1 Tax=Aureibacter tunicatorum TaxID=866807 RepID=A0AAE3XMF9_9BACT|nr:trypsin-like peptidase domain-containing protein [Aureibacter tunicatorum]MDR6238471.1 S1-C subfamily serine protease [Aureibacter tunicatorum]BDD05596.1 hypothetical protein AUTU_30790 [Aureibacter tunicatorum]